MRPRWTVYGEAIDDSRDEETLNDCFADLIDDTLILGPDFLNFLLDGLVEFGEEASIEGTDREPLDYRGAEIDRKIDLTVGDESFLAGIESKRRANLSEDQLLDELDKLRYNADGRDVKLIALTEDVEEPELIHRTPDEIQWMSWFSFAQRIFGPTPLDDSWQPTVSRARKMFREFGYTEFTGIDDDEFQVSVWELWKQLATQVDGLQPGMRWPHRLLKEPAGGGRGWKPIDPDWMLLTFGEIDGQKPSGTNYAILSNKASRELWFTVALDPWGDEALRDTIASNAEMLAERIIEADLELIQFPLNRLVGRKNLPEGHRKNVRAARPTTVEELTEAFSDRSAMRNDGANWFILGYPLEPTDISIIEEATEAYSRLRELFDEHGEPNIETLLEDYEEFA